MTLASITSKYSRDLKVFLVRTLGGCKRCFLISRRWKPIASPHCHRGRLYGEVNSYRKSSCDKRLLCFGACKEARATLGLSNDIFFLSCHIIILPCGNSREMSAENAAGLREIKTNRDSPHAYRSGIPHLLEIHVDDRYRTPSPPLPTNEELWQSQTPKNVKEFELQSTLIRN